MKDLKRILFLSKEIQKIKKCLLDLKNISSNRNKYQNLFISNLNGFNGSLYQFINLSRHTFESNKFSLLLAKDKVEFINLLIPNDVSYQFIIHEILVRFENANVTFEETKKFIVDLYADNLSNKYGKLKVRLNQHKQNVELLLNKINMVLEYSKMLDLLEKKNYEK